MNRRLKRAAERALVLSGISAIARSAAGARALVLLYHNVIPTGSQAAGELSLHLPQREFARQLDLLRELCDVVPLYRLLESAAGNGRLRVAITFDDAYAGAMTAAIEELLQRWMPFTIFVPPGLLGEDTWWDVMANRSNGVMPPALRQKFLDSAAGKRDLILLANQPEDATCPRIADAARLLEVAALPGASIGSHSWSHANLAALNDAELLAELERPLLWLRHRCQSFVPVLAYPYGISSRRVEEAAASVGYSAALLASGGWLPGDLSHRRFTIPRYNVPAGLSLDGLRLRLSGIGRS